MAGNVESNPGHRGVLRKVGGGGRKQGWMWWEGKGGMIAFEVSCIPPSVGTGSLNMDDLTDVLIALDPASSKWRSIGLQLGMNYPTLEIIEVDNRSTKDRFVAMCTQWLVTSSSPRSWSDLARALSSLSVGEPKLAFSIRQKYCHQDEEQLTSPTPGTVEMIWEGGRK